MMLKMTNHVYAVLIFAIPLNVNEKRCQVHESNGSTCDSEAIFYQTSSI